MGHRSGIGIMEYILSMKIHTVKIEELQKFLKNELLKKETYFLMQLSYQLSYSHHAVIIYVLKSVLDLLKYVSECL